MQYYNKKYNIGIGIYRNYFIVFEILIKNQLLSINKDLKINLINY